MLFSGCKGESHTHKQGFKQLFRRLRSMYKVDKMDNKEDFTLDNLRQAAIVVFGCPHERFTTTEFEILKRYVRLGGSVLVMLAEGGETKAGTNINYWLEEYGLSINSDAVVRTTHYKYLHPKEVLIGDGILNRGVLTAVGKQPGGDGDDEFRAAKARAAFDGTGLEFVYPYGATISVQKPAVPVLSSGKIAYPMNRPLGARPCPKSQHKAVAVWCWAGDVSTVLWYLFGVMGVKAARLSKDQQPASLQWYAKSATRTAGCTVEAALPETSTAVCVSCADGRAFYSMHCPQELCGTWSPRAASWCSAARRCSTTSTLTRRKTPRSWTLCSSGCGR